MMLKKIILATLFIPFFLGGLEYECEQCCEPVKKKPSNFHFEIGPEYSHIRLHNYRTPTAEPSTFQGNLWGAVASFSYKVPKGFYFNLNTSVLTGPLSSSTDRRHFVDEKAEGRIGYNFTWGCSDQFKVTPYTGYGWGRFLQRDVGPLDQKTQTPTYYIPVGVLITYVINDGFSIGSNIKWTPQVDATFRNSAFRGRWRLEPKDGWVVELPVTYRNTCFVDSTVSLIPYYRLVKKGEGKISGNDGVVLNYIAAQQYDFWGVKLTLGINF